MIYLTHPQHGAMHVVDFGEAKKLEASGWVQSKEPTAAEINAAKKAATVARLRAEADALDAPAVVVTDAPKRPGRPKKA